MDYLGYTRSNYFRVTDTEKFEDIVDRIITDGDGAEVISYVNSEGEKLHGLCIDGSILGFYREGVEAPEDDDYNSENVYYALQEVIPDGEAIVVEEIGHEGLRYLSAFAAIITKNGISYVNLRDSAEQKAIEMLGDKKFILDDEY